MTTENYKFPVYGTQGGGLARRSGVTFIFVEPPENFPDIKAGDEVDDMWDLAPANELARKEMARL
jgi:hypothetical protein